jgi:surface protein
MSNLVTIEGLANLNTSNVTDMWGMFEHCSSLPPLDLSTFDTRNVEKMAYMLDGCTSLQSLNISSFITSNVKEMGAMFQDCSSLPSLDVTGFDVQNNRSLWGTFAGLTVSTLDISSFNTAKVDDMGYMFARNPNLTTIYVGNGWTTASVAPSDVTGSVGGYDMFAGCTSLVGGAGTPYDANHVDETYAHIDGGTSNPGYFTDKNAAPVVDEDLKDDVYTVGETDFSTEFYTQFSKYYQIPQGGKWVSKFKLNLNPNDNRIYKNFVLLITNDEDRGAGQYKEYGAFRYDAVADSTRTNSQWGTSMYSRSNIPLALSILNPTRMKWTRMSRNWVVW